MARHPELLIPASSLEVLKTAVIFGADAVYIGGEAFGLRAKAKNFSLDEMREGILFAHEHDVKVYVTANILAHNYDLAGVREYFEELKEKRACPAGSYPFYFQQKRLAPPFRCKGVPPLQPFLRFQLLQQGLPVLQRTCLAQ